MPSSRGRRFLIATRRDAYADLSNSAGTATFLLALAGGTWAARYAGLESAADLAAHFSWKAAGLLLSGALLGVVLAWPLGALWRWVLRHIYVHIVANLAERSLLLLALEPDHLEKLPLRPAAPGMPDVTDGSRRAATFTERVGLLIQRYEKCCKALGLAAYPQWTIVLMWTAGFLAVDAVLFVWLTMPGTERPVMPLLLIAASVATLGVAGLRSAKKLAVTGLLSEDDPDDIDADETETDAPDAAQKQSTKRR